MDIPAHTINKPLLSIVMITYNHEAFIERAIKSILEQKIDFPVEFIISNDRSTDNTHNVIEKNIKNLPNHFSVKYYNQKKNLGMMGNFIFSLKSCEGKYIALCEGDDYWIDPEKLKKQILFLETHPDYSLCFTNTVVVDELEQPSTLDLITVESKEYHENDLFTSWLIPTATTIFVNKFTEDDFNFLNDPQIFFGDIILFLILVNKGKLYGMSDYTSAYRINSNSFTNQYKTITFYEKLFTHLSFLSKIYNGKYKSINDIRVIEQGYKLFRYYFIKLNPKFLKYIKFIFIK